MQSGETYANVFRFNLLCMPESVCTCFASNSIGSIKFTVEELLLDSRKMAALFQMCHNLSSSTSNHFERKEILNLYLFLFSSIPRSLSHSTHHAVSLNLMEYLIWLNVDALMDDIFDTDLHFLYKFQLTTSKCTEFKWSLPIHRYPRRPTICANWC